MEMSAGLQQSPRTNVEGHCMPSSETSGVRPDASSSSSALNAEDKAGPAEASEPLSDFWLVMSELKALHERIANEHMREISALRQASGGKLAGNLSVCIDCEDVLEDYEVPSERQQIGGEQDVPLSPRGYASAGEGIHIQIVDDMSISEASSFKGESSTQLLRTSEEDQVRDVRTMQSASSVEAVETYRSDATAKSDFKAKRAALQFGTALKAQLRPTWSVPDIAESAVPEWSNMSCASSDEGLDSEEIVHLETFASTRSFNKKLRKTTRAIFHTRKSIPQHYRLREATWPWWIIHPQSSFKLAIDLFGICVMLYDFIMIPLQFFDLQVSTFFLVIEWITRIFWVVDIWINFQTATFVKGVLTTELRTIAKQYLKNMFMLDFTIVLADWVSFIIETNSQGETSWHNIVLLRMIKGLRFAKVMRIFKLERIMAEFKAQINSTYLLLLLRPVVLIFGLLFFNHMLACFWFAVGRSSTRGWTTRTKDPSTTYFYFTSLHWAISQLHGNMEVFPENSKERIFQCSMTIIALVLFSTFLSSITNAMAQIHALRQDRFALETQLREVLARRHVSAELTARIKKRLDYNAKTVMDSDVNIVSRLPKDLAIDLLSESRTPMVEHHDYFFLLGYRCPRVLRQLCFDAMAEMVCQPEETIFSPGDICLIMYLVEQGELRYDCEEPGLYGAVSSDGSARAATPKRYSKQSMHTTSTTSSSHDSEPSEILIRKCSICEPVLWLTWAYHGTMTPTSPAHLVTVNAEHFCDVIKQFHFAHVNSARYAQTFLVRMVKLGRYTDMAPPPEYGEADD